jgi:glucose-1-phosphate thymidylyltransferase
MRGIVLAGGAGSRLDPMTRVASKQLQPVYDKPMIYYPLATLLEAGIREILLISTPAELPRFQTLLGDGSQIGVSVSYAQQVAPNGIAHAVLIGEDFAQSEPVMLILGDNIFYGNMHLASIASEFERGAVVFGYPVRNPSRYGVVELDADDNVVSMIEKPKNPRSNLAVPGLYLYDGMAASFARHLEPSARGELEITSLNQAYLDRGELSVVRLPRGIAWLDSGTHESLLQAANFIATVEERQGLKIACLEEIALRMGYISASEFADLIDEMPASGYRDYLYGVLGEISSGRWQTWERRRVR